MEKQSTNLQKENYSSIDEIYSEANTVLSIVNIYLFKYKIFNEVERQHIVGNVFLELNERIKSQSLTGGYINRLIRSNVLLFLRPVDKEIKYQLMDNEDFAASAVSESYSSTPDFYSNYQLLKQYLPTKWIAIEDRIAKGEFLANDEKIYKSVYRDLVWWLVKNYDQLEKIFTTSDISTIAETNDFSYYFLKHIQMYYLFTKVHKNEDLALFWRYCQNLSREETKKTMKITQQQYRNFQYQTEKILKKVCTLKK